MNTIPRFAAIGECMVELSHNGDDSYLRSFAGDTLNTAIYLARGLKGTGCRVSYVTALGKDPLSEQMVMSWGQEGIECDHIAYIKDKLPGLYSIELDKNGERSFSYWRSNSAARNLLDGGLSELQQSSLIRGFSHLYLSGITLAVLDNPSRAKLIKLLEQAWNKGAHIIFDNNYRPTLWESQEQAIETVNQVLQFTAKALVTFDDEQQLFGDQTPEQTLQRLQAIPEVVVKNGADGCLVKFREQITQVPARKVDHVLDTTAAGDSFNGGYLAARILGYPPEEAAHFGHAMAAEVIQHKGAIVHPEATASVVQGLHNNHDERQTQTHH